jgi:hypothetical protein
VIPKPGKLNYHLAKVYRVIALQNCLGKVVKKVVATKIADECERKQLLHDGQYGCRKRRSAIDAVRRMVQKAEEAWGKKWIAAVLLMDVKGAFPSVARGNLIKRMEDMGFEADVCRWLESFMSDRRVAMRMDGQYGEVMAVATGVPQGSPGSPILFVIYISELFEKMEGSVEGTLPLSFVDDMACMVEGDDVTQCIQRMQRCASRARRWAEDNAVEFDIGNTEGILFSKKRNNQRSNIKLKIGIGENRIAFDENPTRWLGVQFDRQL